MLGSRVKMLSCPVLKQFAVLLSRRSQYRSRASHQKARSRLSTWLPRSWTGLTACRHCPLKSQCAKANERRIKRWEHEHVPEAVQQRLDKNPLAMRQRRETAERTGSLRTQSARHRVDHGTICGRSCANSGNYKPLCACVDRTPGRSRSP